MTWRQVLTWELVHSYSVGEKARLVRPRPDLLTAFPEVGPYVGEVGEVIYADRDLVKVLFGKDFIVGFWPYELEPA